IKSVTPGSPAQRAGLRPGDEIKRIGNHEVTGMASLHASVQLNGVRAAGLVAVGYATAGDHSVRLVIARHGTKGLREAVLERQEIHAESVLGVTRQADNSWYYWLDRWRRIAQVRITTLGQTTPLDSEQVLIRLQSDGLRGIVLDLRWCPGGYLTQSVDVARLFLGHGVVATLRSRTEQEL